MAEQKDLARTFLEALLGPPRRQQRHQEPDSKNWKCPQSSFCNFAAQSLLQVPAKKRERKLSTETVRRPASEVAVAEAEAKAAALDESAARLRAAGLEDQAASLEKQAGEQRKNSESSPLPWETFGFAGGVHQKGGRSFGASFHARGRCGVGTCGRSRSYRRPAATRTSARLCDLAATINHWSCGRSLPSCRRNGMLPPPRSPP